MVEFGPTVLNFGYDFFLFSTFFWDTLYITIILLAKKKKVDQGIEGARTLPRGDSLCTLGRAGVVIKVYADDDNDIIVIVLGSKYFTIS